MAPVEVGMIVRPGRADAWGVISLHWDLLGTQRLRANSLPDSAEVISESGKDGEAVKAPHVVWHKARAANEAERRQAQQIG